MLNKEKIGDFITNVIDCILRLLGKNLPYHVGLKLWKKYKKDSEFLFNFEILSLWNKNFPEKISYDQAMLTTKMGWGDNLSKRFRHYALFQLVNRALSSTNMQGNVAECGCWQGQSAHLTAQILKACNFNKNFMIFDSFEGLSDLHENDRHDFRKLTEEEIRTQKKQFAAMEELVRGNLKEFDFISYYKGWIPSRFSEVDQEKFSFVNIDVDLYQPIKDCLEFFYPRLLEQGIIFLDDYGMSQFPGAKLAVDEFLSKNSPRFFHAYPFGGAFIVK